jgi:hypothetical protein
VSFTSSARVKRELRIPAGVTTWDLLIDDIVVQAHASILTRLDLAGKTVQTYSETLDIEGFRVSQIALRHRPTVAIAALTDSGTAVAAENYALRSGWLKLKGPGACFTGGVGEVDVTYTAGFASDPEDLIEAETLEACRRWNTGPKTGLGEERTGRYTWIGAKTGEARARIDEILAAYERIVPLDR